MAQGSKDPVCVNLAPNAILSAGDPSGWFRMSRDDGWFVYTLHADHSRVVPPLYVGMTGHLYDRLSHHRRQQAWWPLVGDIVIEKYATRADAAEAEERAIYALQPLFNTVGNIHTPAQTEAPN